MHATQDVGDADFRRGAGELVSAFLAADAADNLVGLELDQDLDEVVCRQAILAGDLLHAGGHIAMVPAGEGQDGSRGVIAFDGQLQVAGMVPARGVRAKRGRGSAGFPVVEGAGCRQVGDITIIQYAPCFPRMTPCPSGLPTMPSSDFSRPEWELEGAARRRCRDTSCWGG